MFHDITFLVKSFVSLARELLVIDGVDFLLSEKLSQDPLEEHFAKQRKKGGCNENPTVEQFAQQEVLLNVMNSDLVASLRGNTRGRIHQALHVDPLNARKLPKKK